MVMGIGLGGESAIAATVFYLLHHIPVKTSLFLVQGIIERDSGSTSFGSVGGLARRSGPLAVLFLLPALSLAGLPPFSGFLAKYGLVRAGLDLQSHVVVVAALAASLLTLVSMTKIWTGLFWGDIHPEADAARPGVLRRAPLMASAPVVLVVGTLAVAALAGPLRKATRRPVGLHRGGAGIVIGRSVAMLVIWVAVWGELRVANVESGVI
eukprot:gene34554-57347_t